MKTIIMSALAVVLSIGAFAQAGPGHQPTQLKKHPRVDEVNKREDKQEKRITTEKKNDELTKNQAHKDRSNLKTINQEKRDMRKEDKSHLTKTDKKTLNQQLNKNSKKIGQ